MTHDKDLISFKYTDEVAGLDKRVGSLLPTQGVIQLVHLDRGKRIATLIVRADIRFASINNVYGSTRRAVGTTGKTQQLKQTNASLQPKLSGRVNGSNYRDRARLEISDKDLDAGILFILQ